MKIQEHFKNVFSYSAGVEEWVKKTYFSICGREISYTFAYDFAICDFLCDKKAAEDTYKNCVKNYKTDYEAMTQLYVCLMYLAYAEDELAKQGLEGREEWCILFQNLAEKAYEDFYKFFKEDEEACQYFFDWTD